MPVRTFTRSAADPFRCRECGALEVDHAWSATSFAAFCPPVPYEGATVSLDDVDDATVRRIIAGAGLTDQQKRCEACGVLLKAWSAEDSHTRWSCTACKVPGTTAAQPEE